MSPPLKLSPTEGYHHAVAADRPLRGCAAATPRSTTRGRAARRRTEPAAHHVWASPTSAVSFVVPATDVFHLPCASVPPPHANAGRGKKRTSSTAAALGEEAARPALVLCPAFRPDREPHACAAPPGSCPYVHANLVNATRHTAHVQGAWSRLEDVPYPRLEPGPDLLVAPPNRGRATAVVPRHHVLRTRAVETHRTVLSRCAHFASKGVCGLGADCLFVHEVSLGKGGEATANTTPTTATAPMLVHTGSHLAGSTAEDRDKGAIAALPSTELPRAGKRDGASPYSDIASELSTSPTKTQGGQHEPVATHETVSLLSFTALPATSPRMRSEDRARRGEVLTSTVSAWLANSLLQRPHSFTRSSSILTPPAPRVAAARFCDAALSSPAHGAEAGMRRPASGPSLSPHAVSAARSSLGTPHGSLTPGGACRNYRHDPYSL